MHPEHETKRSAGLCADGAWEDCGLSLSREPTPDCGDVPCEPGVPPVVMLGDALEAKQSARPGTPLASLYPVGQDTPDANAAEVERLQNEALWKDGVIGQLREDLARHEENEAAYLAALTQANEAMTALMKKNAELVQERDDATRWWREEEDFARVLIRRLAEAQELQYRS